MSSSQTVLRKKFDYKGYYEITEFGDIYNDDVKIASAACTKRRVANFDVFDSDDIEVWETVYQDVQEEKYNKTFRNFTRKFTAKPYDGSLANPPIFLVPRQRGKSYLDIKLRGVENKDVVFMPISKGFSMQGISSFTMGPIVGEGLCLVNAAFSKTICEFHICGGGKVNLKSVNFWRKARKPLREIEIYEGGNMTVDGVMVNIEVWLEDNKELWFEEWDNWRKSVALCSRGDFHWAKGETISYYDKGIYLTFVEWKKRCYIEPSYELLTQTREFQHLEKVWKQDRRVLGLVHPKARSEKAENPITKEYIKALFDDEECMCCQPYVIVGKLLGVSIH